MRCWTARAGCGASREELFEALSTEQFSAMHAFVAEEIMQHIEQHRAAHRPAWMSYLLQRAAAYEPQLRLLQTIPGIDLMGAAMLLVEIGSDMSLFGSAERLASWVGICPGNNESAGKRKSGRIRKGNAWVRRLLCEFAQAAARTQCALKAKFDSLAIRKGHKKSVIALAHKMLRTIYAMLSSGTYYEDKTVDYEAMSVARNAPRWIKMLQEARLHRPDRRRLIPVCPAVCGTQHRPASGQATSRLRRGILPH